MTEAPANSWTAAIDAVLAAAAITTASRTGVLAALETEHDIAGLAHATGCDRRGIELLLAVLVDSGVVAQHAGGYSLPAGGPSPEHVAHQIEAVDRLVRSGRPSVSLDDPAAAEQAYPKMVAELGRIVEPVAEMLAATYARTRGHDGRAARVLDAAAGAAPYASAFARAGASVTALDLPGVLDATRASLAAAGLDDAVQTVPGDLFDVELDEEFDVVVLAGFCRLFGPERAAAAITRCASWLAPGGTLLLVDAVDTLDTRRRGIARYALGLATRTATGRTHSLSAYGTWLAAAGLTNISLTTTDRAELSVISATLDPGERT